MLGCKTFGRMIQILIEMSGRFIFQTRGHKFGKVLSTLFIKSLHFARERKIKGNNCHTV